MICFDCHVGYMLSHPDNDKYLKCSICGFCVTCKEAKEYAKKAFKELEEERGWDLTEQRDRVRNRTTKID